MTFTWLSAISSKKGLMLLSATAATPTLFPNIFGEIDTLIFSLTGWFIVMSLSIWEYWTSVLNPGTPKQMKEQKQQQRSELFTKVITYSLMFVFLIFLHSWISFKYNSYFSSISGFFVVAMYIISALGELNFIGGNIEMRYGTKPPIFKFLDTLNDKFQKIIINRFERNVCKTEDSKEKQS